MSDQLRLAAKKNLIINRIGSKTPPLTFGLQWLGPSRDTSDPQRGGRSWRRSSDSSDWWRQVEFCCLPAAADAMACCWLARFWTAWRAGRAVRTSKGTVHRRVQHLELRRTVLSELQRTADETGVRAATHGARPQTVAFTAGASVCIAGRMATRLARCSGSCQTEEPSRTVNAVGAEWSMLGSLNEREGWLPGLRIGRPLALNNGESPEAKRYATCLPLRNAGDLAEGITSRPLRCPRLGEAIRPLPVRVVSRCLGSTNHGLEKRSIPRFLRISAAYHSETSYRAVLIGGSFSRYSLQPWSQLSPAIYRVAAHVSQLTSICGSNDFDEHEPDAMGDV